MKRLALFDLDNTLLAGDSDFEWAQYLIRQGVLDHEVYAAKNEEFYRQYREGILDIDEFLAFQLAPLARHPREQLEAWRREFIETAIRPLVLAAGEALIARHRGEGHLLVIITATNRFVTAPIAELLGVPHLIATEPEEMEGRFTGAAAGLPSFREGKVARLRQWLEERGASWEGVEESWFYSDSLNDLPLLDTVHHPVAVDPDDTLRRHAEAHGWPVISLRG